MKIYICFMLLLLIQGGIFVYWKQAPKIFAILMTVEFILLSGLRNIMVGGDTQAYITFFERIDFHYTWKEIITYIFWRYWTGDKWFEPLYVLYIKIFHTVTINPQIFLIVTAIIIFIPLGRYLYDNSRDISMSAMIYMCLFFQCFGITAIRQAIGISIVSLWGFRFVKERRLGGYLLTVFVAFLFHVSAIIMLPFYFLYQMKLTPKMRMIYVGALAIIFLTKEKIIQIASQMVGIVYVGAEGQKAFNMVIIMLAVTGYLLIRYDRVATQRTENKGFINAILIGTLILPFTQIDNTYMRLCYYYYMPLMIIIPEIIESFPRKLHMLIRVCAYLGMSVLFIRHGLEYSFFWQI